MTICRSQGFYCPTSMGLKSFDWRDHYSLEELKRKHEDCEFTEFPYAYRFVDEKYNKITYYKMDGNILELPCSSLSFD